MKQSNKTEWAIWGVCALSFAVTLALLPLLPARIPVHWNVDGQIDGWAARPGAFFGPAMGLGLSLLMKFLPYIDPRRRSYEKFGRAYDAFRLALALFALILQGVTLYAAFYPDGLDVSRIIAACVGALLCVAGNYMPKFRHNYFCGIRTPWTLASETCWRRTHRFAGPLWFWGGLGVAVLSFVLPQAAMFAASFAVFLALAVVPFVYSYILYKKAHANTRGS